MSAIRLDKYLADMGLGTRSEIRKAVRSGLVTVDGQPVRDPGLRVEKTADIAFDGKPVGYEDLVYYMLHKPAGVITATEDARQETVLDLIREEKTRRDLFPVGRLDKDTEGLLLITNDGQLAHRLLSPARHVDKRYFARVRGHLGPEEVRRFAEGIVLEDFTALPALLTILSDGPVSEALVTVREGKFHQVRRMFAALDREVVYLKRLSMGSLQLDEDLPRGACRRLSREEIGRLRMEAGLE